MTREEQRALRELEKSLKTVCKETGKRRGWKSVAGWQYRVRDGILYALYVSFPPFGNGRELKADLHCKPVAVDEVYWELFQMAEEAAKQPFSFHVTGAFTARGLWLPPWREPLAAPEDLEAAVEAVLERAEALAEDWGIVDLASYRERLEAAEQPRVLEIVLCLLCEGNYARAMTLTEEALARGENGGFSRENGRRSILEDARDYCAAHLEKAP